MKKDARFWILIGALVLVAGLFAAFLWSVMTSPAQPAGNQVVANVTTTPDVNVTGELDSTGGKPGADQGQAAFATPPIEPPPPIVPQDVQRQIDDARAQAEQAQAEARRALERAQANVRRARERARQPSRQSPRARRPVGDKPPLDDKPPADDW